MAIGNNCYSHFNSQKHETLKQNTGGGVHSLCCPLAPRISAPMFITKKFPFCTFAASGQTFLVVQ